MIEDQILTYLAVFAGGLSAGIVTFEYSRWRMKRIIDPFMVKLELIGEDVKTFLKRFGFGERHG